MNNNNQLEVANKNETSIIESLDDPVKIIKRAFKQGILIKPDKKPEDYKKKNLYQRLESELKDLAT